MDFSHVKKDDPQIYAALQQELKRQQQHLELIASENFVTESIMEASGSHFTNKYAEGYPGRRYYGGCEFADEVETLAINRAKELFGAEHANVQPHSGSQANAAVYATVLKHGDKILGMRLDQGGHLTHGSPVNFSGQTYDIVSYGVTEDTQTIDYEEVRRLAVEHEPKMIVAGYSAYARIPDFKRFREIADEVGAYFLVDMAHFAGLVAAGVHPSPVPYADFVTTTTHKTLRGPRGGLILCREKFAKGVDKSVFPGNQGGPLMHIIAAKAICFKQAMTDEYREYAQKIVDNAKALADGLMACGLKVVSGGTDNHLMLLDLRGTGRTGKEMEILLHAANITTNKNTIPYDPEKPAVTSGVRIGTSAVTSRGMGTAEMKEIAGLIAKVLEGGDNATGEVQQQVLALCERFPLYS